jgi:phosphorylase/glycogen(starch) synthase
VDDTRLWRTHVALKERLYEEIRENISRQWTREGEAPNRLTRFLATLNPSALTLCFARRFTGYKRPTLIFQNVQRIKEILFNAERPVNLIFAGKAHPADTLGAEFIHLITRLSRQDDCIGRVAFLESYDIRLARLLVSGSDVWLNNPTRLMEASGTSGMKAAANGVPNLSILDGWWDEGYDGRNGWAIGAGEVYDNQVNQDLVDAENLYLTLAGDVVPEFWERDNEGVPRRWVARMRAAMRTALADYSTHRMLRDYIGTMYEPTISQRASRLGKDIPLARDIGEWRKRVPGRFSTVTIREVRVVGARGDEVRLGNAIKVTATVDAGQMSPGELEVELVTVAGDDGGPIESAPMTVRHREGNVLQLSTTFTPSIPGPCRYGVRVLPVHPALGNKYEARLVKWS